MLGYGREGRHSGIIETVNSRARQPIHSVKVYRCVIYKHEIHGDSTQFCLGFRIGFKEEATSGLDLG